MTKLLNPMLFAAALASTAAAAETPQTAVDALLAADRAFSAAAAEAAPADGLAAMLDSDVAMPWPGKGVVSGREAAVATLKESKLTKGSRLSWTPVRGGISADGTHGFTFGYATLIGGEPRASNQKYLSYWVKRRQGWRVAAFRLIARPPGEVPTKLFDADLPRASASSASDVETHRRSLADTEKAFSDDAQTIGLRAAFRKYGRPDAMNLHAGIAFETSLEKVTAIFPENETKSPLYWSAEKTLVAPSGDLGVNIGTIHQHQAKPGEPASFPFFTIWRRDSTSDPWRYVAE
jgi:hypothetical protein